MSLILGLISGSNRRTMFSPGWWRVDRLLHWLQVYSAQIYWFTKFVFSRYWLHRSLSKSISKMFAFPIIASCRHHLQILFPRKVFLEKFLKAPLWLLPISCTASNCLSSSTRRLLSHLDPHLWTGLEITRWKPLMFFRLWNFRHRFERAPFTGKNSAVPDLESVPRFRKHLYNQFLNCFLRLASLSELEIRNLKLRVRRNFDFFFGSKHSSFTVHIFPTSRTVGNEKPSSVSFDSSQKSTRNLVRCSSLHNFEIQSLSNRNRVDREAFLNFGIQSS